MHSIQKVKRRLILSPIIDDGFNLICAQKPDVSVQVMKHLAFLQKIDKVVVLIGIKNPFVTLKSRITKDKTDINSMILN